MAKSRVVEHRMWIFILCCPPRGMRPIVGDVHVHHSRAQFSPCGALKSPNVLAFQIGATWGLGFDETRKANTHGHHKDSRRQQSYFRDSQQAVGTAVHESMSLAQGIQLAGCMRAVPLRAVGAGLGDGQSIRDSWPTCTNGDCRLQRVPCSCAGLSYLHTGGLKMAFQDPSDRLATYRIVPSEEIPIRSAHYAVVISLFLQLGRDELTTPCPNLLVHCAVRGN